MPRSRLRKQAPLPPLLIAVIEAASHAEHHDSDADRTGEADALNACGHLARRIVVARGVLAPATDDVYREVSTIASRYLRSHEVRTTFREALQRIDSVEQRDAVESAYNHVIAVSDVAYYYTGLAFGITLAHLGNR